MHKKPVTVHGDGLQTRSMGHASDLAYGTYLAIKNIDNCAGEIINIGNENIRFKELANMLQKITKNNFEFSNKNLNINLTLSQKIDTSLIKSIINQNSFQNLEKYLKNEIKNR